MTRRPPPTPRSGTHSFPHDALPISNTGTATADVSDVAVTCTTNTYDVGGSVSGLSGTVQLSLNGGTALDVSADGVFTFPTQIAYGAAYAVTIVSQPTGQICVLGNASGTATGTVSNVSVSCEAKYYLVRNRNGSDCLRRNGNNLEAVSCNASDLNQRWTMESSGSSWVFRSVADSSQCGDNNSLSNFGVYGCDSSSDQSFQVNASGSEYMIRSGSRNMCMYRFSGGNIGGALGNCISSNGNAVHWQFYRQGDFGTAIAPAQF